MERAGLKALFITAVPTRPASNGGRQRTALLSQALGQLTQRSMVLLSEPDRFSVEARTDMQKQDGLVDVLPLLRRGEYQPWRSFRSLNPRLIDRLAHNFGSHYQTYSPDPVAAPAIRKLIEHEKFDVVVGRYLLPTVRAGLLEGDLDIPVILDIDDLDAEVYRTRLHSPTTRWHERPILSRHLRQIEALSPKFHTRANALLLASDADRELVSHNNIHIVPNLAYPSIVRGMKQQADEALIDEPSCVSPGNKVVLMVGSLTHRVNRSGFEHFIDEVWPKVLNTSPEAQLRIVGSGMTDQWKQQWHRPSVEPVGYADDLAQEYADCDVAVAPLYEGGGTKIKVLEALDYGRPIVVTHHAWRGYEKTLVDKNSLLVGQDDDAMAQAVITLLNDPIQREQIAQSGLEVVRQKYSFGGITDTLRQLFEGLNLN